MECFKKLSIVKPGISGTFCVLINIPRNARVVAFSLVISTPSKIIFPESMVKESSPAIVLTNVDFPEPLRPARRWRAPSLTTRLMFVSNGFLFIDTQRFFITNMFLFFF